MALVLGMSRRVPVFVLFRDFWTHDAGIFPSGVTCQANLIYIYASNLCIKNILKIVLTKILNRMVVNDIIF